MDKFDRIQQLHRIFKSRRLPVSRRILAEELECTQRNVQRLLDTLRLVDAPLEYDKSRRGWYYAEDPGGLFELPGLWLTSDELQSLSLLLNLLHNLGNGLLNDEIDIVEQEVNKLLEARNINPSAFADHIRVLPVNHRSLPGKIFNKVSEALLRKRQVHIHYTSYNRQQTERTLSPQTLVHYKDNWYLDAWCHLREDLRTFSVARMTSAEIVKSRAKKIARVKLNQHFAESYGIFAGKTKHAARLRFDPAIAREIAQQQWHPQQSGEWDGRDYLLTIPYADDRELIQEILRHIPNVYVEAPVALRKKIQIRLQDGLGRIAGRRIFI